jgi:ribose transport system permease protein
LSRYGLVVVWALLIVVFGAMRPDTFLTWLNFRIMFNSQALLVMLALGLVICMVSGDFDLSLSGVFSVSMVVIGRMNITEGIGYGWAILVALFFGLLVGLVHAVLIVKLGLASFIVTLGSGTAFLGLAYALSDSAISGVSGSFTNFISADFGGLQVFFFITVGLVILLWYVYGYTPLGRQLYFVGASREVARLAGLPVERLRAGSLIAASMVAALTGVLSAAYLDGSDPTVGGNLLLPVTSSTLLGATAIWPGRANPWGAFVASYFLVTGYTGLQDLGLSGWIQQVFYGGALVVAIAVSHFAGRGTGGGELDVGV